MDITIDQSTLDYKVEIEKIYGQYFEIIKGDVSKYNQLLMDHMIVILNFEHQNVIFEQLLARMEKITEITAKMKSLESAETQSVYDEIIKILKEPIIIKKANLSSYIHNNTDDT